MIPHECLPKAVAVVCFLTLIYHAHMDEKSSTDGYVKCKHSTGDSSCTHTHSLLHPAEGCGWCGPISFGCCSQGKHTLLIRPTDWLDGEGGEAQRKKKRKIPLKES